jgi:hypothetical protein
MISRKLLKTEIDKVKSEHLELLYGIIKLLENGIGKDMTSDLAEAQAAETDAPISLAAFTSSPSS